MSDDQLASTPAGAPSDTMEGAFGPRRRFTDSYGLVLLLLVISYFCDAALGDYTWGRVVVVFVLAAATWLALRASQLQRRSMRIAQALIPLLCVVAVASLLIGQENVAHAVTAAITVALVVIAPVAILSHLAHRMALSTETFLGAVCVYLLIAQLFATLFALTAVIAGQPFFVQTSHPTAIDYIYFSFVTITTVGYGDFTSALPVGKMMAVTEAVFGQLYLITVVSLVVQNLGTKRQQEREAGKSPRA
jgi:voltage-gated potassium channel